MAKVVGSDNADWLGGTSSKDIISGLGGDDTINAGGGDDLVIGGAGADTLNGGGGIDTASYADFSNESIYVDLTIGFGRYGTADGDTLISIENLQGSVQGDGLINGAANVLFGGDGDDFMRGMGGADMLDGGDENDRLIGGSDGDILNGGNGLDVAGYDDSPAGVIVSLIDDIAAGGDAQGDDLNGIEGVSGSAFSDLLLGDDNANWIAGFGGGDTIKGFGGDDRIHGSTGHDVINGGTGVDNMDGGDAADTFVWSSTSDTGVTEATSDVVADFNFAEGDRIDLGGVDANVFAAGNQAFTFIGTAAFSGTPGEINYVHSGGNTYIQMQTGTSADVEAVICLQGIVTPQASWFVL